MKYKSKELENELSFLRDNIIKGIKEGNSTLVSEGLATYKEMVKVFIDKLKQFNATYDRERALKECNYSIEMGPLSWPEIEWLRDNIREITDESFVYPRQSILSQVLFH